MKQICTEFHTIQHSIIYTAKHQPNKLGIYCKMHENFNDRSKQKTRKGQYEFVEKYTFGENLKK